jgi:IclR family acetate operon transcriptional repressor
MKALASALRILDEFALRNEPLGVTELADRLGIQKSNVSKVLSTFRDNGYLVQDPTSKKYLVGLNLFALGNNYINSNRLSRVALPTMRKLVDETGHSAVVSVMQGGDVIHVLAVEGRLFVDGRWRVGVWMPFHATSAGKVLLAFGPPHQVDNLIKTRGLPYVTNKTIVDPRKFSSVIQKVHKCGFSVTRGETLPGSSALAVPLFDGSPFAVATLGLICPEHLLTDAEAERLLPSLHKSAREVSLRLGASIYPFGE